jgi:HEAT repeat protein
MTQSEKNIIQAYQSGEVSGEAFLAMYPIDLQKNIDYVLSEIEQAILKGDEDTLEKAIQLMWFSSRNIDYIDILNRLLLVPFHRSHQSITKVIQDIRSPSSVPFIRKVLESNFEYLAYTCSESGVIAKWFSWALYRIGTKEAIDLMKEFTQVEDEGIRDEMLYRLKKYNKKAVLQD